MVNFLTQLFRRLFRKQAQSRRARTERARRLHLESVEPRCLMAADFATIRGNVFTDLTDNGKTPDDTAITSGVTVRLFRDGGNGNFESAAGTAAGDDTLIGTPQTADASGNYLFEDLEAGRYFVQQAAVTGKVQRTDEALKIVDITTPQASGTGVTSIDTFTDTTTSITANTGTPTASSVTATSGTNTIGNERDLVVNYTSGANNIDAQVSGGLLSVNPGATTQGNVVLTYDGTDGNATTINHSNLNVNLRAGGATAFQFLAGSEAGNTITVDVFSGAGNFSTLSEPLPITAGAVPTEVMILRFDDFVTGGGTGANFSAVTAMRIQITTAASSDAQLDLTQTVIPFSSTQDFANLNPMSIGNRIWRDNDQDGLFDAGEPGIQNVDVELYADTNNSGGFNAGDTLIDTQTTNASGNYVFTNLLPDDYITVIPGSNFTGGALEGFTSSPNPDIPNNDVNDRSKAIDAGGGAVSNGIITLVAGGEPTNDGDSNTNTNLSLDLGFTPDIDLDIQSVSNAATYSAGQNVTYTLTVTNNGPAQADNVVVTENIPNFLTVTAPNVTATGGTVTITNNASGEVQVSYPNIPSGQSRTITIVGSTLATLAATTAAVATATVTGQGLDSDNTNNTDTTSIDIDRLAVLQITKTDTPDPGVVGQTLNYQIVVNNVGPSTATNVQVRDTLPAGLTFNSVSSTVGTATHSNGLISLDLPTLAVGASATINVATTIQAGFSGSTIANSATADADEAVLVTANASTTVNPRVDLSVTTTDSADPIGRGAQLTYTLQVRNDGPSGATNVQLVNTLPTGVTFVSASGPTGTTVTPPPVGSNNVTIGIGNLAAAATATVTIIGAVSQTAAASLTNSVTVNSTESTGGFDINNTNNTDTETTATTKTIDLELTKTDNGTVQNPIRPGGAVTYTLTARNNGPTDATGVRVVDNIPDGVQITSAAIGSTSVTVPASAGDTTPLNPDDITFDVGALASGATATITIIGTVLNATRGDVINTAVISTTDATLTDSNSANNSASRTTALSAQVDLAVTKTATTTSATAGGPLVYQIDVTNNGPSAATGVSLTDTLPSGVTFSSVTAAQGTASHANGVVTGNLGTIAPGATVRVTVNATVNADSRGTLSNTATVTATETDSNAANNSSTVTTTLNSNVDLQVTSSKTNPNDPAVAGGALSYSVVVTNAGLSTANNVVVTNVLPNGVAFTSGSVANQSTQVTAVGQQVTANIGTLGPNETRTITINGTLSSTAAGTLSNSASATATETDANTANNSATLVTPVAVVGSIVGKTYLDSNKNGIADSSETGISGVAVALSGTDILGRAVSQTTTTDNSGNYSFNNLQPGTYAVTQTQPQGFRSGQSNPGSAGGTAGDNSLTAITLTSGTNATANNFGETPNPLSLRRFLASSTQFD